MKNPNNHNVEKSAHLRRTSYDLSHSKHMSGEIGKLYPVMCEEMNPGETFHWSPNFNFRFAPTALPLQTRIKCVVDYFFVPYKAVWKNQNAFFTQGMNNGVTPPAHPWLKMTRDTRSVGSGSLGDYLGVPSSISTKFDGTSTIYSLQYEPRNKHMGAPIFMDGKYFTYDNPLSSPDTDTIASNESLISFSASSSVGSLSSLAANRYCGFVYALPSAVNRGISKCGDNLSVRSDFHSDLSSVSSVGFSYFTDSVNGGFVEHGFRFNNVLMNSVNSPLYQKDLLIFGVYNDNISANAFSRSGDSFKGMTDIICVTHNGVTLSNDHYSETFGASFNSGRTGVNVDFKPATKVRLINWFNSLPEHKRSHICMAYVSCLLHGTSASVSNYNIVPFVAGVTNFSNSVPVDLGFKFSLSAETGKTVADSSVLTSPREGDFFASGYRVYPQSLTYKYSTYSLVDDKRSIRPFIGSSPSIPLNALPFRGYELCYNYWYRNRDIDPLLDANGKRVVDQFLLDSQMADGADEHEYLLHNALLEKDIFTSCFTEPLVNYNPLIGIRQKENGIFYDFATSGGVVTMTAGAGFDNTEPATKDHDKLGAMITSYGDNIPQGDLAVFKDIIYTGITNQDIYSAQCLQRWISNKVQKGYNFSEQQMAQFGVNSSWNPLTSPIYLGGTAEWINNGCVVNTSKSETAALGEMGGMPSCISGTENHFSYTAHDRGFIMGILRIVPIPIYSQAIHKFLTKGAYTDYFIPEFDNKGYEAVPKGELCPYLASESGKTKEAFGYQVPWYDYKSSYDTISGDMRVNFNDSVLMRDFATLPALSKQFIECRAEDYNDVFENTKQGDKFIGEIFHTIKADRIIADYQSRVFSNIH